MTELLIQLIRNVTTAVLVFGQRTNLITLRGSELLLVLWAGLMGSFIFKVTVKAYEWVWSCLFLRRRRWRTSSLLHAGGAGVAPHHSIVQEEVMKRSIRCSFSLLLHAHGGGAGAPPPHPTYSLMQTLHLPMFPLCCCSSVSVVEKLLAVVSQKL